MRADRFECFSALRESFRRNVERWSADAGPVAEAQRALAHELGEDDYEVQTPVVYNRALDDVDASSDIAWIVVADNPGKREQLATENRYLVGRSGMMAEAFFRRELGVDFRRGAVILNKTPVHTPKTAQLRLLVRRCPEARRLVADSQRFMASLLPAFQEALDAPVWIMGLSELGPKGLFAEWRAALEEAWSVLDPGLRGRAYAFNHFSMGSFATDLKRRRLPGETARDAVLRIGAENRNRIFAAHV